MQVPPLKRIYLALENWFNYSFGSWNPLYHLGTLTFFFFWIVLISGIYLFIFFHGSLDGAYASVDRITHAQWYAGGIMRSLHRYASDAAVGCILLHMFREFALDRHHGARWYSWFTGVPLLWMVVTLGITGYWLVWDKLAQYIAIGSAHLMDVLPIFFGSMARNFLEGALSDRFFILIEFLHLLGQPMLLVFALWFHVRRLSNVSINPPRGLAIGSLLALLALSIVKPATSHEPADLTTVPQLLNLDWFYLNIYPLLDYWSAGQVWVLTIGITLLLMLLPWLPPRKAGPAAVVDLDYCDGCKQCFYDCPFDAISVQARSDGRAHEHEVTVEPALCAACGICVGACHSSNPFRMADKELKSGIDMPQFPVQALREKTKSCLAALEGKTKILVFGCEHGFDVTRLNSRETAGITLLCSGMLPPTLIEYALRNGADGVMVSGCRHADCYFRFGNRWMEQRLAGERPPVLRSRVDRRRITIQGGAETDQDVVEAALAQFRERLSGLVESEDDGKGEDR